MFGLNLIQILYFLLILMFSAFKLLQEYLDAFDTCMIQRKWIVLLVLLLQFLLANIVGLVVIVMDHFETYIVLNIMLVVSGFGMIMLGFN
jgi:hypothetical protein